MPIFSFIGTPWPSYLEKVTNGDEYINKRIRLFIHHACPKRVEKKKLLGRNKNISLKICWGSHLCKMAVTKCVHKTQKNQKLLVSIFNSALQKKQNFWTSIPEISENLYLFLFLFFISWLFHAWSLLEIVFTFYFFDVTRNKHQTTNI